MLDQASFAVYFPLLCCQWFKQILRYHSETRVLNIVWYEAAELMTENMHASQISWHSNKQTNKQTKIHSLRNSDIDTALTYFTSLIRLWEFSVHLGSFWRPSNICVKCERWTRYMVWSSSFCVFQYSSLCAQFIFMCTCTVVVPIINETSFFWHQHIW